MELALKDTQKTLPIHCHVPWCSNTTILIDEDKVVLRS